MIFYVDLDGVLVASIEELFRLFGNGKTPKACKGSYDTATVLGFQDPWSRVGHGFFANAGWTEDGAGIFRAIGMSKIAGDELYFLTSPTYEISSASGKLEWIARNFPPMERKYIMTPHKHLLARRDALLIDDCDEVADKFIAHGGQAILIPRPWNSRYRDEIDIPDMVSREIRRIRQENNI